MKTPRFVALNLLLCDLPCIFFQRGKRLLIVLFFLVNFHFLIPRQNFYSHRNFVTIEVLTTQSNRYEIHFWGSLESFSY